MANVTLETIHKDLEFLKNKVNLIEKEISIISDMEPGVRSEYIEKLNKIKKEKGISFKNIAELRDIIEA